MQFQTRTKIYQPNFIWKKRCLLQKVQQEAHLRKRTSDRSSNMIKFFVTMSRGQHATQTSNKNFSGISPKPKTQRASIKLTLRQTIV